MENKISSFRNLANGLLAGEPTQIPEGWRQGRTAYGGLTAGLCLAAIERDFKDLPPLKSMQMTFVGPVPETPHFETRLLRQGRNVTSVEAKAISDDQVCGSGIFMFGAARTSSVEQSLPAPSLPEPESCHGLFPEHAIAFAPGFFHRFDTRLIQGAPPLSGADEAYVRCWSRHRDEPARTGMDSFICLGDVQPPAAMPTFKKMSAISSMNWHMNILVDDVTSAGGWYQVETAQSAAKNGYSSQVMRFWNRNGELIAEGMQSVAIFA